MGFVDRADAGARLAAALAPYAGSSDAIVVGLPRGGLVVAWTVARTLALPLDVLVVRKLGVPWQPELAMGAVASGGVRILNSHVLAQAGISAQTLAAVTEREIAELTRREHAYRGERPALDLGGATVLLVDDGLATGATARSALAALRQQGCQRVVLAVPVGASDTLERLQADADEVVCLETPTRFRSVGQAYADFAEVDDLQVRRMLESS